MKQLFLILFVMLMGLAAQAQNKANPGEAYAAKVAQRLKDSLNLSPAQQAQLLAFNRQLHQQKMALRQQYSQPDSIARKIQGVENKRDGLYKTVLSAKQYARYRKRKAALLNNN